MGTVILGMDFGREKFKERAAQWQRVSSYRQRKVFCSSEHVDVVEYRIPAALPANKGKKIIWFSDLHFRGDIETDSQVVAESSELINDLQPEYLIYGGDIVTYSSGLPLVRTFLNSISAKIHRMAVLGNWEYAKRWLKHKDWKSFFESAGFELLVNSSYEDSDFFFYGIDELRKGRPMPPKDIPENKETVFLAHSPDAFIHINDPDKLPHTNLVLCGHTHGGQIRIPFWGAVLTSSRYWRKFDYGQFRDCRSNNMIVSAGMGCSTIPVRINCRREMVLISFE